MHDQDWDLRKLFVSNEAGTGESAGERPYSISFVEVVRCSVDV